MQKIALFVEGLTESAFIRALLLSVFNPNAIALNFVALGSRSAKSPYDHEPQALITLSFLVIDVGGDGNVLSSIRSREKKLLNDGYVKIIGLQDLNCDEYDNLSNGKIKKSVTDKFIKERKATILEMSDPKRIKFFFSIMEIESWLLALPRVIYEIDVKLTKKMVEKICKKDLGKINPEDEFYSPSTILEAIYFNVGKKYNKSFHCVLSLTSKIKKEDINELLISDKCKAFKVFFNELTKGYENLKS